MTGICEPLEASGTLNDHKQDAVLLLEAIHKDASKAFREQYGILPEIIDLLFKEVFGEDGG